jgi:hypothetical protein
MGCSSNPSEAFALPMETLKQDIFEEFIQEKICNGCSLQIRSL